MLHDLDADRIAAAVLMASTGRLYLTMHAEIAERVVAQKVVHQPAAAWLVVRQVLVQKAW